MKNQIIIDALVAEIAALKANRATAPAAEKGDDYFELIVSASDKKLAESANRISSQISRIDELNNALAKADSKNRMLAMKLNECEVYAKNLKEKRTSEAADSVNHINILNDRAETLINKVNFCEKQSQNDEKLIASLRGEITTLHGDIFELQKQLKINNR